jgi:hypothetical protein
LDFKDFSESSSEFSGDEYPESVNLVTESGNLATESGNLVFSIFVSAVVVGFAVFVVVAEISVVSVALTIGS